MVKALLTIIAFLAWLGVPAALALFLAAQGLNGVLATILFFAGVVGMSVALHYFYYPQVDRMP